MTTEEKSITLKALRIAANTCQHQSAKFKLIQGCGMDQAIGAKACELEIEKLITAILNAK